MGGEELRRYIVCYDYGTGGLWWIIKARSVAAIAAASSDLTVFDIDARPEWMSYDNFAALEEQDLHAPTNPALISILAGKTDAP